MPRRKVKETRVETVSDPRDFAMARIAAALAATQGAIDDLLEAAAHFIEPDDDKKGQKRHDLLQSADESLGIASRAVQAAQDGLEDCDKDDLVAEEPEDEDEEKADDLEAEDMEDD